MFEVILDALLDSLKVLGVLLLFNFLLSFCEDKLAKLLNKNKILSPLVGSSIGLIPQCGFSVVSADLYQRKKISMGTLVAVFIACSDEALPILFSYPDKYLNILLLLLIKFVIAFVTGLLVDLIFKSKEPHLVILEKKEDEEHSVEGCCHHKIGEEKESFVKEHILHPLIHSLKIFAYVLVINVLFAILVYLVGENNIKSFIDSNVYLTPLFATIIGFIPNCASSVILTELYIEGYIYFSATLAGLICNAGLGLFYLFKNKNNIKNTIFIIAILFIVSIISGYLGLLLEIHL